MAKRVVIIFSEYNASEKTLCALYFAQHVLQRYRHVVWVSPKAPNPRHLGFSHKWDSDVLALDSQFDKIKKQLSACEMCVFFEEGELLRSLLPSTTKTVFIPNPHRWTYAKSYPFAAKCTYVVSVSEKVAETIVKPNVFSHSFFCPFTPTLQLIPRPSARSGSENFTLFYSAYDLSSFEKQCLSQIAEIVKTCCPSSKSVIGYYDRKTTPKAGRDTATYDWKLLDYLKQTDWVIDLNPRPHLGLFTTFAGDLDIPWSGFDISPNTDKHSASRRHLVTYPEGGLTLENTENIALQLVRHFTHSMKARAEYNRSASAHTERVSRYLSMLNHWFKPVKKSR